MDFEAQQGRGVIGKRRKTSHHNALTIRDGPSRLVPRHVPPGTSRQLGSGARQNHDIRIRIGDEALTNRTYVQTSSQIQASVTPYNASLEDTTLGHDALHRGTPKPGQQADPNAGRFGGAPTHAHHPRNSARGATPRSPQLDYLGGSVASVRAGRNEGSSASPNGRSIDNSSSEDHVSSNKNGEVSKHSIMQQLEGHACSLRLTFDTAAGLSAVAPMDNASSCNLIGESNHDHCTANAMVTELGNVQTGAGATGSAGPRLPRSIDDGPWISFFPGQTDSSSPSATDDLSALNRAHDRPSLLPPSGSADYAPWSQRATRGARTLGNVSPSLPSITRKSDKDELRERLHTCAEKPGRPKKQSDENDEFWKRLVFGNDNLDSAGGIPGTETSPDKVGLIERRIPPPLVVSRSSTPFDPPLYGPGSCVSDSTQAAAARAPLVTSSGSMLPMITSSTAPFSHRGQVEEVSTESGAAALTESSGFGLQPVTHTSMQNNVSYVSDASSSERFGDSARRWPGPPRRLQERS
jgi:hypothetical protein